MEPEKLRRHSGRQRAEQRGIDPLARPAHGSELRTGLRRLVITIAPRPRPGRRVRPDVPRRPPE